jgi:hypothetical protein
MASFVFCGFQVAVEPVILELILPHLSNVHLDKGAVLQDCGDPPTAYGFQPALACR